VFKLPKTANARLDSRSNRAYKLGEDERMRVFASLVVVSVTLFCGCASHDQMHFKAGRGDAGRFILLQAVARGGQLINTTGLPAIRGAWSYSEDQYGVVIRMPRGNFEVVEKLLRQAFGEPKFGPSETTDGGKLGGYRLTPQGGAIQFGYNGDGTQVSVVRQLSQQEFADGFMRAMKKLGNSEVR
jgi:hypothetical protein